MINPIDYFAMKNFVIQSLYYRSLAILHIWLENGILDTVIQIIYLLGNEDVDGDDGDDGDDDNHSFFLNDKKL